METSKKREMFLLETINHPIDYWDAELRICINGQKRLQEKQLSAMKRMYKNWNDWRVRLGVWLISKTEL